MFIEFGIKDFIEDAKKVVDFLTKRALDGKTMYYVPRKYRKKI